MLFVYYHWVTIEQNELWVAGDIGISQEILYSVPINADTAKLSVQQGKYTDRQMVFQLI